MILLVPILALTLQRPTPPKPTTSPTIVTYGKEKNKNKGNHEHELMDPPLRLIDNLFHLRDKTDPRTLTHIQNENESTAENIVYVYWCSVQCKSLK